MKDAYELSGELWHSKCLDVESRDEASLTEVVPAGAFCIFCGDGFIDDDEGDEVTAGAVDINEGEEEEDEDV